MTNSENNIYNDDRLIKESGLEAKVANIILPTLHSLGFRAVRIYFSGLNGNTLQVMIERPDGTLTINDCEFISRTLSPLLDVADIIPQKYHLEISSPGIDRPLVRKTDFEKWEGHLAKVETINLIHERKRFRGIIQNPTDLGFNIYSDQLSYDNIESIFIAYDNYESGRLILTDELIKETLKKEKQLAKNNNTDENLS
ncbi:ribosome maturation factor RimP [Bartonella sp. DGB1]|uniref:ribosome maturation factor RimP n=1 Tax=Bartonella sp. DGB1 TaxID=3239807 RepID=UPI00352455C7